MIFPHFSSSIVPLDPALSSELKPSHFPSRHSSLHLNPHITDSLCRTAPTCQARVPVLPGRHWCLTTRRTSPNIDKANMIQWRLGSCHREAGRCAAGSTGLKPMSRCLPKTHAGNGWPLLLLTTRLHSPTVASREGKVELELDVDVLGGVRSLTSSSLVHVDRIAGVWERERVKLPACSAPVQCIRP